MPTNLSTPFHERVRAACSRRSVMAVSTSVGAGGGHEGAGGLLAERRDLGVDDGEAEVGRPGDAEAGQVELLERVEVADRRGGQARAVAGVGAGHHVEQQGGVGDGGGDADPTTAFWARCVSPKVGMRP